jgi:hypothetical protein
VIVAWLVLAGLPFGGERRDAPRPPPRAVETVKEAPPPQASATIVDVPASTPPNVATAPTPVRKTPAPVIATPARTRAPEPAPNPAAKPPAASTTSVATERREITGAEAESSLRSYVASYYRKSTECIRVDNRGYENVGYSLEVWDRCDASGGSHLLGRWRVDAKTRDIYRQREDGRYLRP